MTSEFMEFEARGQSDFWFACVDIKVLRDPVLSPYDVRVFAVICSYANVQTRQWALKVQTIAENSACSVRAVQRSIRALVERGVIERFERFSAGRQRASLYRIVGYRAKCYENTQSEIRGDTESGYVESVTPMGDTESPQLLEPRPYENKTYSPTESAEPAQDTSVDNSADNPEPESGPNPLEEKPVDSSEVPTAMRQVVKYFLHETGRDFLSVSDLGPIRDLERLHYPARINQEIDIAVDRFRRTGRDPTSLTFDYLYESLKHQPGRRKKPRASPSERKREKEARSKRTEWEREQQRKISEAFGSGWNGDG